MHVHDTSQMMRTTVEMTPRRAPGPRRPPRRQRGFLHLGRSHRNLFERRTGPRSAPPGTALAPGLPVRRRSRRVGRDDSGTARELAMILADTDVLIDFLAGSEPVALRMASYIEQDQLGTTAITAFELLSGARNGNRGDRMRRLVTALPVLALDR